MNITLEDISQRPSDIQSGDSVAERRRPQHCQQVVEASDVVSHIPKSVTSRDSATWTSNVSLSSDDYSILRIHRNKDGDTIDGSVVLGTPSSVQGVQVSVGESPSVQSLLSNKRKESYANDVHIVPSSKKSRASSPASSQVSKPPLRMLARPEDLSVLNDLHVFVRQQIEVFTATATDMAQPAPGRKNPIRRDQVGLRCIHCRHLPSRERVKRAVCYPSSVGRVYHSVSDMKFDHFSNCRGLPDDLRARLTVLKAQCKRGSNDRKTIGGSSSSTAQYYHDSALRMGMHDRCDGIFMAGQVQQHQPIKSIRTTTMFDVQFARSIAAANMAAVVASKKKQQQNTSTWMASIPLTLNPSHSMLAFSSIPSYHPTVAAFHPPTRGLCLPTHAPAASFAQQIVKPQVEGPVAAVVSPRDTDTGPASLVLLAMDGDTQYLNPLHCFVRRNVGVFVADNDDIAAPAPGRKTRVHIGQVGIRCIHCAKIPPKQRVKRAICYPPSISGIYHSVSNMKFDHFGSCRALPANEQEEFTQLRINSSRRGGSTSNGSRGMANSTAQYYHDSALRLGLVDTTHCGMRFASGVLSKLQNKVVASDGISALMMAATNPLVRAEYNRRVIEQAVHEPNKVAR